MIDPLAEVVALLQPRLALSKLIGAAGRWRVRRSEYGQPFYCVLLEGSCRLAIDGAEPMILAPADFVLIPSADSFTMSSLEPPVSETKPVLLADGEFRLGTQDGTPEVLSLIGYCEFGSPDAALLVSLLPRLVHVRGETRLATLVELVRDESRKQLPGRDVVLARLLEVLLINALRSTAGTTASPGLVRGLADERLAAAIRRMHEEPTKAWTVAQLAKVAALSRSAFFVRFNRAVGLAPMEYLLAWRMALAKRFLLQHESAVADVAERVGYSSASTFTVAFTRHVGLSPARYARSSSPSQVVALRDKRNDVMVL
jgi:AraC-like DNA-binding protein